MDVYLRALELVREIEGVAGTRTRACPHFILVNLFSG